jgi:hypothetical protein
MSSSSSSLVFLLASIPLGVLFFVLSADLLIWTAVGVDFSDDYFAGGTTGAVSAVIIFFLNAVSHYFKRAWSILVAISYCAIGFSVFL